MSFVFVVSVTAQITAQLPVKPPEQVRTEALARRATERLQALQREADRLASEERSLLGDLRKLEIERQMKAEELNRINADAASVGVELGDTNKRMAEVQQAEVSSRRQVQNRLAEMYKLGEARYVRILLSTSDLQRLGQATRTVSALSKIDRDRIAEHRRRLAELDAVRATLGERAGTLDSLRAQAQTAHTALDHATRARADLIQDIDRQRDLNAQLTSELQAASQRLQSQLRSLRAGAEPSDAAALPLKPFRGDLDWPAAGSVKNPFGRGARPKGIEIATADGAPVRAIHEGIVAFADAFAGFGNLVIVDHGAQTFSLYGDLLDLAVAKGARVERGQPVGSVGPLPTRAAGLYFELRVDGQPVDPLQWLRKK
ncbi:MAG TPA: peptidoglycan DD-metalloendopeptidase family protein [Vicinamibacterales bacterium]|nr:peptidoglycan DD-metalloendopeptidase family protein [Vicinamibacterales bacterium]